MVQHALAVFDCEDAEKWHGHEQLYISRFGGPDATWDIFKCWDGQLPDLAAATQYRTIFITGSHYSAYEDLPWINNLVAWLHKFVMGTHCATKTVAVCFGSQVIARALGGRIGKNASGRFVLTVEDLSVQTALREKRYFKAAVQAGDLSPEACRQLKVLESHGDQVLELPEGAELLATSPTAPNEIWTYQDRVLAIQGHPEMPCKEALHKILPFLSSNGRLSEEEAAASKHALENVEPDWATIQRIMEKFIATDAETSPAQGVEPAALGYSSWLPSMTLPSMPGMPAMSLPSVPMPSMGLPSLSLPDWIPLGSYSSSPVATQQVKAGGSADSSITAKQSVRGQVAATQSTFLQGETSSDIAAEASKSAEHVEERRTQSMSESAPADSMSKRAEDSSLPISTHATGVHASTTEGDAAQPSGSAHASRVVSKAETSPSRISSADNVPSSSTSTRAEEFLEHVSRAVAAELDGSLCNMQLLFGVNTVARGEFQRILQELLHWAPLVEDMKRKQEQCTPMLKALDVMEARMDSIEAAIKALDQQSRKLVDST